MLMKHKNVALSGKPRIATSQTKGGSAARLEKKQKKIKNKNFSPMRARRKSNRISSSTGVSEIRRFYAIYSCYKTKVGIQRLLGVSLCNFASFGTVVSRVQENVSTRYNLIFILYLILFYSICVFFFSSVTIMGRSVLGLRTTE